MNGAREGETCEVSDRVKPNASKFRVLRLRLSAWLIRRHGHLRTGQARRDNLRTLERPLEQRLHSPTGGHKMKLFLD